MRIISAERLRLFMTEQHVSVRVLATDCGVSHSMIQQLRSGARTSCTPVLAAKIAQRLGQNVSTLFEVQISSVTGLSDQRGRLPA